MSLLLLLSGTGGGGGPGPQTISVGAIASAESVPGPAIAFSVTISAGAIATGESVGAPNVFYPLTISVSSIPSATGAVTGPTITVAGTPLPGPASASYLPRITAANYTRAGALIAELDESYARSWQDPLNDTGAGRLTLQNDDTDLATAAYGSVVRFSLDNAARFSMLVESKDRLALAPGEEVDEATVVAGRGTLAIFEEAVVEPVQGTGRIPFHDTRLFNWASPDLSHAGWGPDVRTSTQAMTSTPTAWPDPLAQWMWDRWQGVLGTPAGDVYFRKSFIVAAETDAEIWIAADDEYELWLDGAPLIRDLNNAVYLGASKHVRVTLDAGDHLLAILGRNNTPGLRGAVIVTVMTVLSDGTLGSSIVSSSSGWAISPYPPQAPGFTPGQVVRILVEEAQARGALVGVTLAFDDFTDSAGTPWPETGDIAFQVGTDLLSVLRQLAETYFDLKMAVGSFTLYAYATRGSSKPVTLAAGTNLTELRHAGRV